MGDPFDVIVAAYQPTGSAQQDLDALVRLVAGKPAKSEGVILVELSIDGQVGFGKWHLTPDNVQGPAGPFDRWPQAWGFDHWWGFLSGAAGQYDPIITQDNSTLGVPEGKDGGQFSGRLNHTYSFLGVETYQHVSTEPVPTGDVTVKMLFAADENKPGTGGTVTLWANGKVIGEGKMPHTVPLAFSSYAGMDIGRGNGLVVDLAYEDKAPYPFTGTVKKVVFDLQPATHEDEKALREHAQMHAVGQGAAG